jgi:hypothetical protein
MERALAWLPLLGVFIWLAWAGWNEYQKVQTYEAWATAFERSKYDIRAVLGQKESTLTWGRPTRQGPVELANLSLEGIDTIEVHLKGHPIEADSYVKPGQPIELVLTSSQGEQFRIPFIELPMAQQWKKALQESLQALKSASS